MSRAISLSVSGLAVVAVVVMASAGVAAAQSRGEWRGAWEATPQTGNSLGDQFFRVKYSTEPRGSQQSEISGYVYNDYGEAAANVQLEITELDADGHPIASETRPVAGVVPAVGRAYFDIKMPRSASYRITVRGFDFLEESSTS